MQPKQAFIPFLKLIFQDRKNLFKALLRYTKEADKRRKFYKTNKYVNGLPFVDIHELVGPIKEELTNYTFLDGTSRVIDIAFLMALCKQYTYCNYLEIGSWRGESLSNVAKVATKCTSLSLSKKEMEAMGFNPKSIELQGFFSKNLKNIHHIEADSQTFDFNRMDEKFDVIFIDGDHTYTGVKKDTQNAFNLLRDDNSVIIWHDCGGGYEGFRFEVIQAILDGAPREQREKIYRVSNTLCGIYTNQSVNAQTLNAPQTPKKTFTVNIKSNPL